MRFRTALAVAVWVGTLLGLIMSPVAAHDGLPGDLEAQRSLPTQRRTSRLDVPSLLAQMTLEDKVGQLFMIHAYGTGVDDASPEVVEKNQELHGVDTWREVLSRYPVGGVIYFNWTGNVESPEQVARLSNELQAVALERRVPVPLLIAADQEHGLVLRIGEPATEFPGNMALAATGDLGMAYWAARIAGEQLAAMGVNVNFVPVADVNVNPANPVIGVRSFGDRPEQVARFTAAQVAGYRAGGVAAAAKHFPGHGNTDVDSHTGLPRIPHERTEVENIDLPPFRAAVEAGVDMIMTAHIVVPSLDDAKRPATMSEPVLTGLLRERLGFEGIIVTDALTMEGARQTFDEKTMPVEILKAGADLLLMPPDMDVAYGAVLEAVYSGALSEERIDESVRRILNLKLRLGLFDKPFVDEARVPAAVGQAEHRQVAARIAQASVTLVKNASRRLPLAVSMGSRVLVTGWGGTTTVRLAEALRAEGLEVWALETGADPGEEAVREAVDAALRVDYVVVLTREARSRPAQQTLVHSLLSTGTPVIGVAVGTPYDIAAFPQLDTYLALYGYRRVSLEALARVLVGKAAPEGRLPVGIPMDGRPEVLLYPWGHDLTYREGQL